MIRTLIRVAALVAVLCTARAAEAQNGRPYGFSEIGVPLVFLSQGQAYTNNGTRADPTKGVGFGAYVTGSLLDELMDRPGAKFRFGDVVGGGAGFGIASPWWLNVRLEVGGQFAYEFTDWL